MKHPTFTKHRKGIQSILKKANEERLAGNSDESIELCDHVLQVEPNNKGALHLKANIFVFLSRFQEAEQLLNTAISVNPSDSIAWRGLLEIKEKLNNKKEQVNCLQNLCKIYLDKSDNEKKLTQTVFRLADVYKDLGSWSKSRVTLKNLLPGTEIYSVLESPPSLENIYRRIASAIELRYREFENVSNHARILCVGGNSSVLDSESKNIIEIADAFLDAEISVFKNCNHKERVAEKCFRIIQSEIARESSSYFKSMRSGSSSTESTPPASRKTQLLSIRHNLACECVSKKVYVREAFDIYLDLLDVSSPAQYPIDVLNEFLAKWGDESKRPYDFDEYLEAADFLLSFYDCTDVIFWQSSKIAKKSTFAAFVACYFEKKDASLALKHSSAALSLADTITHQNALVFQPMMNVTLRYYRAQAFLFTGNFELVNNEIRFFLFPQFDTYQMFFKQLLTVNYKLASMKYHEAESNAIDLENNELTDQNDIMWYEISKNWARTMATEGGLASSSEMCNNLIKLEINSLGDPEQYVTRFRTLLHCYFCAIAQMDRGEIKNSLNFALTAVKAMGTDACEFLCSMVYLKLGEIYSALKDFNRAPKCWRKAIDLMPYNSHAVDFLSKFYIEKAEENTSEYKIWLKQAFDVLLAASKNSISNGLIWARLGFISLRLSCLEEAENFFQLAIRSKIPAATITLENLYIGLGEAFIRSGKYSSAIKALLQAKNISENNVTLYLLAFAHMKLQLYDDAKTYIRLDYEPSVLLAGDFYFLRAKDYFSRGLFGDCLESIVVGLTTIEGFTFTKLHSPSKKRFADMLIAFSWVPHGKKFSLEEVLYRAYEIYCFENCYLAAANSCLKLYNVTRDPEYPKIALNCLKKCIILSPNQDHRFWNTLGVIYAHLGEATHSQHCFIFSLKLDGRNHSTWTNLGLLYEANMETELAKNCYQRSLTYNPDYAGALFGRARISPSLTTCAHMAYDAIITTMQNIPPQYMFAFAKLSLHVGRNLIQGENSAEKYIEWDSENAEAWNILGCLKERNGNLRGALAAFKNSVRLQRANTSVLYNLARVLAPIEPIRALELYGAVTKNETKNTTPDISKKDNEPISIYNLLGIAMALSFLEPDEKPPVGAPGLQETVKNILILFQSSKDEENSIYADDEFSGNTYDPDFALFLAKVCYFAERRAPECESTDIGPFLQHRSNASALCAFGILKGKNNHVETGMARMSTAEKNYISSLYHTINGSYPLALRALQRSVVFEPFNNRSWGRLASHMLRYTRQSIPLSAPSTPLIAAEINTALGLMHLCSGNAGGALKASRRMQFAVRINPSSREARENLAASTIACDVTGPVETLLLPALDSIKTEMEAYSLLLRAEAARMRHDLKNAIELATKAVSQVCNESSDNSKAVLGFATLGRILMQNGECEQAIEMFKNALYDPISWAELARAYGFTGMNEAAISLLNHAAFVHSVFLKESQKETAPIKTWPEAARVAFLVMRFFREHEPVSLANDILHALPFGCEIYGQTLLALSLKRKGQIERAHKVINALLEKNSSEETQKLVELAFGNSINIRYA